MKKVLLTALALLMGTFMYAQRDAAKIPGASPSKDVKTEVMLKKTSADVTSSRAVTGDSQLTYSTGSMQSSKGVGGETYRDCDPITTFPYFNDFENFLDEKDCWIDIDNDGDGYGWFTDTQAYGTYGLGVDESNCLVSQSYDNNSGSRDADNYLLSPEFELPAGSTVTLSWYEQSQDSSWPDWYEVMIAPNGSTEISDFASIYSGVAAYPWTERTADISAYAGTTVRVVFHHQSSDCYFLDIDNMGITVEGGGDPSGELTIYADATDTQRYAPVYTYYGDTQGSAAQFVVPASQLTDMVGGEITSMKFYANPAQHYNIQNISGPTYAGYMTEVQSETMSQFIDFNSATNIFNGNIALTDDCLIIDLATPYTYNGGNLAIAFLCTTSAGYCSTYYYSASVTGGSIYRNSGTANPVVQNYIPKTTFTYISPESTGLTITPDVLDLGYRPNGAWMAPYVFTINGSGTTVNALDFSGNYFTYNAELPATLTAAHPLEVALTTGTAEEGLVEGTMAIIYSDNRDVDLHPITAYAYDPVDGDVVETAIEVANPVGYTHTPEGVYHNYNLPGEASDGADAVYKLTFASDVMLDANVGDAEGGKVALYPEGFNGEGGPMATNNYEYNGPQVGPGPKNIWFSYPYTGSNTFFGSSTSGIIFGYELTADVIAENELAGLTLMEVESAAREAYPYDLIIMTGSTQPENIVYYQPMGAAAVSMSFFNLPLSEPYVLGEENTWILFMTDSPYSAYCGINPADVRGQIWYSLDLATWYYEPTYTPEIYCHFLELPTGREMSMDLASMTVKADYAGGTMAEATAAVNGTSKAAAFNARKSNTREDAGMFVPAGTYYLVAQATETFTTSINVTAAPAPEQAVVVSPYDGETYVESPYLAEWILGDYTTEMQVLFGTQYPPQTALIDWTSDLVESMFLPQLQNNETYFLQVNERNAVGTTYGEIVGFTTPIDMVEGFTAESTELYPGESAVFTWDANRSIKGYNIYQDGVKINENLITTTTYTVEGLEYNMTNGYTFNVTAVYDEGESFFSNDVVVYMTGTGFVNGHVWEYDSITPVYNVQIALEGTDEYGHEQVLYLEGTTNPSGYYTGEALAGNWQAVGYKDAYQPSYSEEFAINYTETTDDIDVILLEDWAPLQMIKATEEENDVLVEWSWEPAEMIVDFETGDFTQAEFTLPAQYPWTITTTNPYEGTYCMKSTCEGIASGTSSIEATVDVPYEGKMGFWVRVSSESNYDKFHFYIDGVEQGQAMSGQLAYAYKEYSVTEGTHTYKWEYAKDSSVNSNDDCVYVDYITMYRQDVPVPPTPGAQTYDFEDMTMQGWTAIDGGSPAGYGWQLVSDKIGTGNGHNASTDAVLSQSYDNNYGVVYPDNYLVAPERIAAQNGAAISFYACAQDGSYPAEHFGVAVSTGNATAAEFTTIQEWTMTAKGSANNADEAKSEIRGTREQGSWYQYTVDLSSYAGQQIWVAIRHFNCSDQFYLLVDDITLADGSAKRGGNDRTMSNYVLYRRNNYGEEPVVEQIATPAIDVMNYVDAQWPNLPFGEYQWGIQVHYEGNHNYPEKGRATTAGELAIDFETGDFSQFAFVNTSAYPWTIVTDNSSYVMKSSNSGVASSESAISATVEYVADGTVSFDALCMGEGTSTAWDKCIFEIDGAQQFAYGANVAGWNNYSFPVTAGTHTFTWKYTKDSSVNPTGDYMEVDNIIFNGVAGGSGSSEGFGYSDIIWSNTIEKDMTADVVFNVSLNNGQSPIGAAIAMVGEQTYNGTVDELGFCEFPAVRKGNYDITVTLAGYDEVVMIGEVIEENEIEFDVTLVEQIAPVAELYVSPTGWVMWEGGSAPGPQPVGDETFTEGFEGGLNGWNVLTVNAEGGEWLHSDDNLGGYDYTELAHGGTGFAMCYSFVDYVSAFDTDSYLYTPQKYSIVNGSTLTFWADNANDSYPENFSVCVATADNPTAADFTQVWSGGAKGTGNGGAAVRHQNNRYENWRSHSIDLSAYAGQQVYIAFHDVNYDAYEIWIDDVELAVANKGNRTALNYIVMLDGQVQGDTEMPFFQHDVEGLEAGSEHITKVRAVYTGGNSDWAEYTWTYTPCDNYTGMQSYNITADGSNVTVSFVLPEGGQPTPPTPPTPPGTGEWFYYDNGVNEDAIGTGGSNFWWGVMFPAGSYTGTMVTKTAMYDYMAMTGNVTIYNDGTTAPANAVGTANVTMTGSEDFVETEFAEPVVIDPTKNLWIVYYNGSGATYPASVCANTGDANGRWVSLDGSTWEDLASYDLNYTFMVRAYVATGAKGEVVEISAPQGTPGNGTFANAGVAKAHRSSRDMWDLLGAFIFVDGELITYEPVTTSPYTFSIDFPGEYEVCVRVVYSDYAMSCYECETVVIGEVTCDPVTDLTAVPYEYNGNNGALVTFTEPAGAVAYKVYVEGTLLGSLSAQPIFINFEDTPDGEYLIGIVAVYDDCESDMETVVFGWDAVEENAVVSAIYPNPTSGDLHINATAMTRVSVYNTVGQMVYDQTVNCDEMVLDMSQFEAGVYMVNVVTENGTSVKRITVVK